MKIEEFFIDLCASFSEVWNRFRGGLYKKLLKTPEERLKEYAKLCGIKKITEYIYMVNGIKFPITEIEGGDILVFGMLIGIPLLSQQNKEIVEQFIKNSIFKLIYKSELLID